MQAAPPQMPIPQQLKAPSIPLIRVLASQGTLQPGSSLEEPTDLLLRMYRWMLFGHLFDERLFHLQRQGKLLTYAPVDGQEAVQVGCGLALHQDDWLFGSFRDGLASIIHGFPPEHLLHFFRGHPKAGQVPDQVNVFEPQVGVAEHIPHAVGVAWGMRLRSKQTATLALFGDGATSEGAFHEGANFAGVLKAPVVLVCQNNGWAISVPRTQQTASESIAQKSVAYGILGRLVDGNDVIAVYREVGAALQRARAGEGPTLIETITYRLGPHSTADDPSRYRDFAEVAQWRDERHPLSRLRAYLEREGLWDQRQQEALEEELGAHIGQIVKAALSEPLPSPAAVLDHIYATSTPPLELQRKELREQSLHLEKGPTFP